MSPTYTRWIEHGESADVEVVENLDQQEVEGRDHDFGIHVDMADDDYDEVVCYGRGSGRTTKVYESP